MLLSSNTTATQTQPTKSMGQFQQSAAKVKSKKSRSSIVWYFNYENRMMIVKAVASMDGPMTQHPRKSKKFFIE